jgi:hypothetical protein
VPFPFFVSGFFGGISHTVFDDHGNIWAK